MFETVDEKFIRQEKEAAKLLRKSRWWQNKIANCSCYYCQKSLKKSEVTMDHVVPIARGGKSSKGNVVPACKDCNIKKKFMTVPEWEDYLKNLL